jgi:hypothetical protein
LRMYTCPASRSPRSFLLRSLICSSACWACLIGSGEDAGV